MEEKSVDELFAQMVADHENLSGQQPGLLHRIKYSVMAMSQWGVYKLIRWAIRQIFPSKADGLYVRAHAADIGIEDVSTKSVDALRDEIRQLKQNPPAGGKDSDWQRWAKEPSVAHEQGGNTWIERVATAIVYENHRGSGTVNVVITADLSAAPAWASGSFLEGDIVTFEGLQYMALSDFTSSLTPSHVDAVTLWEECSESPSAALIEAVRAHCDAEHALGLWDFLIIPATRLATDITIVVTGSDLDTADIADQVDTYMRSLGADKSTFYRSQLVALAIGSGADSAEVTVPADDVSLSHGHLVYERIWPGTITITVAS